MATHRNEAPLMELDQLIEPFPKQHRGLSSGNTELSLLVSPDNKLNYCLSFFTLFVISIATRLVAKVQGS